MPLNPDDPIIIHDANDDWMRQFNRLAAALRSGLGGVSVEHIGSTAVPGLGAKPILDIAIAYQDPDQAVLIRAKLPGLGYESEGERGVPGRETFRRTTSRTPESGDGPWMDHHLYLAADNGAFMNDQRLFRDYLTAHPAVAHRYETLKRSLADAYRSKREAYTEAKGIFVRATLAAARSDDSNGSPPAELPQALDQIDPEVFSATVIRAGTVLTAAPLPGARRAAIVMEIDFGAVGVLKTSAQVTGHYRPEQLLGRQLIAVVNLPAKQIGPITSRCLVLGASDGQEIVLLSPDEPVPSGARVH